MGCPNVIFQSNGVSIWLSPRGFTLNRFWRPYATGRGPVRCHDDIFNPYVSMVHRLQAVINPWVITRRFVSLTGPRISRIKGPSFHPKRLDDFPSKLGSTNRDAALLEYGVLVPSVTRPWLCSFEDTLVTGKYFFRPFSRSKIADQTRYQKYIADRQIFFSWRQIFREYFETRPNLSFTDTETRSGIFTKTFASTFTR